MLDVATFTGSCPRAVTLGTGDGEERTLPPLNKREGKLAATALFLNFAVLLNAIYYSTLFRTDTFTKFPMLQCAGIPRLSMMMSYFSVAVAHDLFYLIFLPFGIHFSPLFVGCAIMTS